MNINDISSNILYGAGYDSYFKHQIEIINKINDNLDKNIIIQAPTSSGKTLAISPFIYNEFQNKRRIAYSVPSKAMIFDKIKELNGYFDGFERKPIIKKVGSDDAWRNGNIVIGTFEEIYTGALNQNILSNFDDIILDDFHVLYGQTRGYTLEKLITFILTNLDMKVIALSATIAPLDLLSKWLKDAIILKYDDDVRPVKLKHEIMDISDPRELLKINNKPILIFCSTKKWTMSRANDLKETLAKQDMNKFRNDRNEIINKHKKNRVDFDIDDEELLSLVEYGVAYHHGSLDGKTKNWIEEVFKEGKINYLFATTTLAYGINLPVKSVLIYDISRWNGTYNEDLPRYEWEQMMGRAGRTGFQEDGFVYSCFRDNKGKEQILNKYLNGKIEDVESSIEHDDCLKKVLLDIISINKGTEEEILKFFRNSLFMVKEDKDDEGAFGVPYDLKKMITEQVEKLLDMGYIERKIPKRFVLTDFGKTTVGFLQTTFGDYNLKALRRIRDRLNQFDSITPEEVLIESIEHSALSETDQSPVWLYPGKGNLEYLNDNVPAKEFSIPSATSYVVLNGWLENVTVDNISRRFDGKWATYVKTINDNIAGLLGFSKMLLSFSKAEIIGDLDQFIERVKYGVTGNMLSFIKIKGFGRKTTINTYEYFKEGTIFKNLPKEFQDKLEEDILEAFKTIDNKLLISYLSAIHGIGTERAQKIFEAIDRDWTDALNNTFKQESKKHGGSEVLF